MSNKGEDLMFGPLVPLNLGKAKIETNTDMGAMTDLVKALKDVEASPENINQNKHSGTGTITEENIKLSEDNSNVELG